MIEELLKSYNLAIEAELHLIRGDLEQAHKKDDRETLRLALAYSKGLERSSVILATLMASFKRSK